MNIASSYRYAPSYALYGNAIKRPERMADTRFGCQSPAPAHDKTILIVDDEKDKRDLLVNLLTPAVGDRYNIVTAANVEQAQSFINQCKDTRKLFIYMDKNLKDTLNGVELAKQWYDKKLIKRYQVIFTSTDTDLPAGWNHYPKGSQGFSANIINAAQQFLSFIA